MDLLEYQGKQLFARHGIPVPAGEPASTVDEAVAAANRIGYPCAIKAQVQVGGRGKLGGIKLAADETAAREYAEAILGMDIKGLTVRELWIERASQIEAEYYASFVFDRGAKAPLAMLSTGRWRTIEMATRTGFVCPSSGAFAVARMRRSRISRTSGRFTFRVAVRGSLASYRWTIAGCFP